MTFIINSTCKHWAQMEPRRSLSWVAGKNVPNMYDTLGFMPQYQHHITCNPSTQEEGRKIRSLSHSAT